MGCPNSDEDRAGATLDVEPSRLEEGRKVEHSRQNDGDTDDR